MTSDDQTGPSDPALAPPVQRTALQPFVEGHRLASLPAKQHRRATVLAHVVETSFTTDRTYDERAVDDVLRAWCEGGQVDHVALRRYLVDGGHLVRRGGVYARDERLLPPAGRAEAALDALGLS